MDIFTAIVYGVIQGVSEFLPISSSGHLALLPFFMETKDPGVFFDLLMHLGTAFAVIVYFHKDILFLCQQGLDLLKTRDLQKNAFFVNFSLATVASVVLIMALKDLAFDFGRSKNLIAFNLIFFGALMFLADLRAEKKIEITKKFDWKRSIAIGLSQALAIFPGVSRSGITMTTARASGMSREESGRFSFLMSLPIILASIAYKVPAIIKGEATFVSLPIILVGIFVSLLFGFLTIHFFLKLITRIGLSAFSLYRLVIGIAVLIAG